MKCEYCKECFYYNESIIRVKIDKNDDIPLFSLKVSKCNGNYKKEPLRKKRSIPYLRLTRIGLVNRKRVKICYFHCTEIHKIKYCFVKNLKEIKILKSILSLILTFKKIINQNKDNIIDNKDKICINHLKTLLNGYYEIKELIGFDKK